MHFNFFKILTFLTRGKFVDGMFATMYGVSYLPIDEQGITFVYITFAEIFVHIGPIIFLPFLVVCSLC